MTHAKPRPFTLDELRAYLVESFRSSGSAATFALKTSRP